MTLLVSVPQLEERRALATTGQLAPLAQSLRRDLDRLIAEGVWLPSLKAKLTRTGGRCPEHGVLLTFDPWEGHRHRCPQCARVYDDEVHHRWWIMNRQLWIAERAVHAALLAGLTGDDTCARLARDILDAAATRYLNYPNVDNVLGPTRPFFSTYLESIWTLQLAVALDLLEAFALANSSVGQRMRERLLAPSAALIASFDEGMSNRQVWNNAALLACGRLLDRRDVVDRALTGPSGLEAHLKEGLLADGSWYEGENYHQFAHRGLWYGVMIAEQVGASISSDLVHRFDEAFALPFLTALPDFTFPARRDSQYKVSLRQWRYAESCELGLARRDDARLTGALGVMYRADLAAGETGRSTSTAEAERNEPPVRLDRSSLGWKSLLCAKPDIVPRRCEPAESVHLASQGLAIFRRDRGSVYAALDYGAPGGGHGHPDRLNLWLVLGDARVLEDFGTGSYTDPSLFWYRSTLAHNAPLIDGASQPYGAGVLVEHTTGEPGVVAATFDLAADTRVSRRLTVLDGCLVDELRWISDREVEIVLPWHASLGLAGGHTWKANKATGASADHVRALEVTRAEASERFAISQHGATLEGWVDATAPFTWARARAPGPPGEGIRPFVFWSARGLSGGWRTVLAWSPGLRVVGSAAGVELHWTRGRVQHVAADRSPLAIPRMPVSAAGQPARPRVVRPRQPLVLDLSRSHYRRSELSWDEAGSPTARVTLSREGRRTALDVDVRKAEVTFAPARPENPLDNEHPDINSDGVQLYLATASGHVVNSWLMVPEQEPHVRVTPRSAGHSAPFRATWRLTSVGWSLRCEWPAEMLHAGSERPFRFNVVVNEISPDRERRRGQLIATGANQGWVYLRGDREDPAHLIETVIQDE